MIVLTSKGMACSKDKAPKLIDFFQKLVKGKSVLIVNNAVTDKSNIGGDKVVYDNFITYTKPKAIDMYRVNASNITSIYEYDIVYLMGGDMRELIKLNGIDFASKLNAFICQGGVVVGQSAGSMILGHDVSYYYELRKDNPKEKYRLNGLNPKGYGLVDVNVIPHADRDNNVEFIKDCKAYEKDNNIKFLYLNDNNYVVLGD